MKKTKIIAFVLYVLASSAYSIETVNTLYYDGIAPITVDGDISDWNGLNIPEVKITNPLVFRNTVPPRSAEDLSASFRCFADKNYVYMEVTVIDDVVVFGNHEFGQGWNDDAVEVNFDGDVKDISKPYFDINDGQIRVTADKEGNTLIEGAMPFLMETQPPYFWEARGVLSGFKQNQRGYTVEVAIPFKVLGWDIILLNKVVGVNIRIFDDDNEENNGMMDSGISWAADPFNTSFWKTQYYNRITFFKSFDKWKLFPANESVIYRTDNKMLTLELTDINESSDRLMEALVMLSDGNWAEAEIKLEKEIDKTWALPLISILQAQNNDHLQSLISMISLKGKSKDIRVMNWVELQFNKFLDNRLVSFTVEKKYIDAILILEKMISNISEDNTILFEKANVYLARYFYYMNEYDRVNIICRMLINSSVSSNTLLNANALLFSVYRKEKQNSENR